VLPSAPLTTLALLALSASKVAKGIVGFSGVLSVIVANAYPTYNVLQFSSGSGEKALAHLAYIKISQCLMWLLLSLLFGVVCLAYLPFLKMTLKAEHYYTPSNKRGLYNSQWTDLILIGLFILSGVFAFWGFQAASEFFNQSGS